MLLIEISFVLTNYVIRCETFQSHSCLQIVNLNQTWKKIIEQFQILDNGQKKSVFYLLCRNRGGLHISINPFVPNAPFLYPLKTSENSKVF